MIELLKEFEFALDGLIDRTEKEIKESATKKGVVEYNKRTAYEVFIGLRDVIYTVRLKQEEEQERIIKWYMENDTMNMTHHFVKEIIKGDKE